MADAYVPPSWRLHALVQRLWEAHGHPGEVCEIGSRGIGSCVLAETAAIRDEDARWSDSLQVARALDAGKAEQEAGRG